MDIVDDDFNAMKLETALNSVIDQDKKGEFFWPLRVALSGKKTSPGPFEIMEALGKVESLKRLNTALDKCGK
jgi:glutamyl/glutaminyl-tRNA synthetase